MDWLRVLEVNLPDTIVTLPHLHGDVEGERTQGVLLLTPF